MSTSLLYPGFGRRGDQHVCNHYYEGAIHFHVRQDRFSLRGPACRSYKVQRKGGGPATVPNSAHRPQAGMDRFAGPAAFVSAVRGVASGQGRFRPGAPQLYPCLGARCFGIVPAYDHQGCVPVPEGEPGCGQRHSEKKPQPAICNPKLKKLKQIAIDEISIGKGHRYLTIVPDLKSGAVIFVGDGKGAEALEPFWQRPRRSGARSMR